MGYQMFEERLKIFQMDKGLKFFHNYEYNIFKMANEQQAIGMMEGAFFVGKGDLLGWVNSLLQLEITAIQQLGTGAVYCQIIDYMFPGKVPMQRVNWKAKNEWEFINNYKILQQSFAKCKVQKHIQIEKLSKSKYQDNLQFIQWLKRYFDLFNKNTDNSYDPKAVRKGAVVDFSFVDFRKPTKKRELQKMESRVKSKSPYDKVKPRINNRSVTIGKYDSKAVKSQMYLDKLSKIRDILKKSPPKGEDALKKIQSIVEEIQEDLPPIQEQITSQAKLETVPSKSMIKNPSTKKKQVAPEKKKK